LVLHDHGTKQRVVETINSLILLRDLHAQCPC